MKAFSASGRYWSFLTTSTATAAVLAMAPHAALAAQPAAASTSLEEIVITGSRIARRDADAPSPIMTVGVDAIEDSGNINVEAAMNEMPQFTRDSSGGQGTGGRALLDLRGLGANRNLVLLDGRRLPVSSASGQVDTNIIPLGILQNVEVITGGASAVYGSDAISGVVNFITNRNFQGVRADLQYSNSFKSDYAGKNASGLIGGTFADNAGYAVLSVNYTQQDPLWGKDRADFFRLGVPSSFIGQGTFVPSANNLPTQTAVDTLFAGYGKPTVPRNFNLGFNDDGTLFGQNGGASNYKGPIDLGYQIIGGNVRMPVLVQGQAKPSVVRRSVFSKFDYQFNDSVTAYGQILFTDHTANTNSGGTLTQFGTPMIPVTNPFIPADLATLLASRPTPGAPFAYNSRYVMLPGKNWDENYVTQQYLGGLKGNIGSSDWTWDVYTNWDSTRHNQQQNYAVFLSRVQTLFNAPDGGASICAGGYNPFGLANVLAMSQQCKDYIGGETHSVELVTRRNIEANLQGTVLQLPAGPAKVAFSANSRKDKYTFSPDKALAEQDVQAVIATQGSAGSISVNELAAEFAVPVFSQLDLGAAYRYSDYNLSGGTSTYKFDATWRPLQSLMVRGGVQRAIRAPNISELFSAATGGQVGFNNPPAGGDPCDIRTNARINDSGGKLRQLCITMGVPAGIVDSYIFPTTATGGLSSGNLGLTPEKADTLTFGAVFTPYVGDRSKLFVSVDYFNIEITDVISTINGTTALNKCYNLDGSNPGYSASNVYCQLITRDANGLLDLIRTPYLNLGKLATSGVDLQANYKLDTGIGSFSVNTALSLLRSFEVQALPGDTTVDEAGTIGGGAAPRPKLRALTTFGYERGPGSVSLRWLHINSMNDRSTLSNPSSTIHGADSYDKFDLVGRLRLNDKYEVRAGVTNLLDKDPLVVSAIPGNTDSETYDVVGRSYYVGLTASF